MVRFKTASTPLVLLDRRNLLVLLDLQTSRLKRLRSHDDDHTRIWDLQVLVKNPAC